MFGLTGIAARVAYAILVGVVTFLVIFIVGVIVAKFEATIGLKLEQFAPLIGLLAGLVAFFAGRTNTSV